MSGSATQRKPSGTTTRRTGNPLARAGRPMGKDRPAQQTGDTRQDSRTRQADQAGPDRIDLDSRWAAALDCPPVRQTGEFDYRPTAVSRIMLLVADCYRWGDEKTARWIEGNWERWGIIHGQLQETERFIADCLPDTPKTRISQAARLATISFIEYRLLERGTIREFRARIEAAWRKLHVGEERLP